MDQVDRALEALGAISLADFARSWVGELIQDEEETREDAKKSDDSEDVGKEGEAEAVSRAEPSIGPVATQVHSLERQASTDKEEPRNGGREDVSTGPVTDSPLDGPKDAVSNGVDRSGPNITDADLTGPTITKTISSHVKVPAMGKAAPQLSKALNNAIEDLNVACTRARPYTVEPVYEFPSDSKVFGANLIIRPLPPPGQARSSASRLPILIYAIPHIFTSKKAAKSSVAQHALSSGILDQIRTYGAYGRCEGQLSKEEAQKILARMNELATATDSSQFEIEGPFRELRYTAQRSRFISPDEVKARQALKESTKSDAALQEGPSSFVGALHEYCQRHRLGAPQFLQGTTELNVRISAAELGKAQRRFAVSPSVSRMETMHIISIQIGGKRYETQKAYYKIKDGKEAMAKVVLAHLKLEREKAEQEGAGEGVDYVGDDYVQ